MSGQNMLVGWFEIPATDLKRAVDFYNEVLGKGLEIIDFSGLNMAMFPMEQGVTSGALVEAKFSQPSDQGTTVYFVVEDVEATCKKVESAGGAVVVPKTKISDEYGFYGQFMDTEGNRVGLHSIS